eukprot:228533_1
MAQHLLQSDPNEMEGQGANEIYETLIAQQVMIEQLQRTQKWSNATFIAILLAFIAIGYSNQFQMKEKLDSIQLSVGPEGPLGPQGIPGANGTDGRDGINGKDGIDGQNGAIYHTMRQTTDSLQANVVKLMPFIIRDTTFNVVWSYPLLSCSLFN